MSNHGSYSNRAAVLGLLGALAACSPRGEFLCASSEQCPGGACEADGHCSFLDEACDSGRRYGEHGGAVSNTCVPTDLPDASRADGGGGGDAGPCEERGTLVVAPGGSATAVANVGCAGDDASQCGGGGGDVLYDLDLPSDGVVWITAAAQGPFEPAVTLTDGTCDDRYLEECLESPCGEPTKVLAALHDAGPHCLIVDQTAPGPGTVTVTVHATDVYAEPITAGLGALGDTCAEEDDQSAACVGADGEDLAYFTVLCAGTHGAIVCPTEPWVPYLYVRTGPDFAGSTCDVGNAGCSTGAISTFSLAVTELVFVVVDGFADDCGGFTLGVD